MVSGRWGDRTVIYLIYQPPGESKIWYHIARATTKDEVLFNGDYRAICGLTASGKRHWNVADKLPPGALMCRKCEKIRGWR